jgi:hypothetical protein
VYKVNLDKIKSPDFEISSKSLKDILALPSVSDADLLEILAYENRLTVGDFLQQYPAFSWNNLLIIEQHVNKNLDHDDRLHVLTRSNLRPK